MPDDFARDSRPPSATRIIRPDTLSPTTLDELLAKGWYRIGQSFISCDFVNMEQGIRGVIWTRVPLATYSFRKSLRKLIRKVERKYEVSVQPCVMDEEHQRVYSAYLAVAPGERPEDLREARSSNANYDLFDTREVSIRLDGELVAFSWFDLGEATLQSVMGVYDPRHAEDSLGFYTMLKEVEFGLEHDLDYFYSGYILCDDPAMDYKLRTGHIEFLDRTTDTWVDEANFDVDRSNPLGKTRRALEELSTLVGQLPYDIYINEHFSLGASSPALAACLAYPEAIVFARPGNSPTMLVVGYDTVADHYELLQCARATLTSQLTGQVILSDLLITTRSIGAWRDPHALANHILRATTPDQAVD